VQRWERKIRTHILACFSPPDIIVLLHSGLSLPLLSAH
jgi:hypothetical protein